MERCILVAAETIRAVRQIVPDAWIVVGGVRYNNVNAVKELDYISKRGIDIEVDDEEAKKIIKSKNVQLDVNPFILDALETLSFYFESKGFYSQALYFYRIMYDLTNDNSVLGRINSIQNKI